MKKVLVVGLTQNFGGVESVVMNYFRSFDKKDCEFHFVKSFNKLPKEEEIIKLGGKIHYITPIKKNIFKFYKQLNNLYKNNNFDVMWFNSCMLVNFSFIKYAKKYGVNKIIIHSHNSQFMDTSLIKPLKYIIHKINRKKVLKCATDFWSCSIDASKFFYEKNIINSKNHKIINNAIDLDKFKFNENIRNDYREKLGLNGFFVIGNVGRLHTQKNQTFLINVFQKVYNKNNASKLLIVGQGKEEKSLKEQVNQLNLQNSVIFTGARNDVPNLMQAIDCFALPSLYEGLPVVGIEAQASGVKCLFSDAVPSNIQYSNSVKFLPLDEDVWIKEIFSETKTKRETCYSANFDIKIQAKKVEKYLME